MQGYDHLRTSQTNRTVHLAYKDGNLVCGTQARTVKITARNDEAVVDCSKCRDRVGWHRAPGSLRSRTSLGLDSSAWGANKGR